MRFFLSKQDRLKHKKSIQEIYKTGRWVDLDILKLGFCTYPVEGFPALQMGVSVSKKRIKKAVDRNKIKRQLRESYRLQKNILTDFLEKKTITLHGMIVYKTSVQQPFEDIYEAVEMALKKLKYRLEQNEFEKN